MTAATRPSGRVWLGRAAALATVGAFGAGSLLLSDWLRDQSAVDARIERGLTAKQEPILKAVPATDADPRMSAWLDANVRYGPARQLTFGSDRAWFVAGTGTEGPTDVFPRLLGRMAATFDPAAVAAVTREGPSSAIALRLSASIGRIPGGASLVRLPPDVVASGRGNLRTEPGVVVLALQGFQHWEYLTFYFPKGLDLDALIRTSRPSPRTLDALGPAAEGVLEPALALSGGDRAGGPSTVLCKARGRAGDAIDRVADSLSRLGWRDAEDGLAQRRSVSRVLTGPDATVWMTTADREQLDGMVTVLIGPP